MEKTCSFNVGHIALAVVAGALAGACAGACAADAAGLVFCAAPWAERVNGTIAMDAMANASDVRLSFIGSPPRSVGVAAVNATGCSGM